MKKGCVSLILILILILNLSFIFATFEISDSNFQSIYGPSSTINGWVNISLDNQLSNSLFEDNFGNSISLIDLIKQNENFIKTCSSANCETDYSSENEETSKTEIINQGSNSVLGIHLSGNDVSSLSSFSMKVESNNPESEDIPLFIDVLNDGKIEWKAYAGSDNFGKENFGCFKDLGDTSLGYINQLPYCEKITLPPSPGAEIGAYVKGAGTVNFDMIIKNSNIGITKTCIAKATGSGRISCVPEGFSVDKERDYFVCIKTKSSEDDGKYQIAFEKNEPCGFTEPYTGKYVNDFEIFASPEKYASLIDITFDNTELANSHSYISNIEDYMESYIRTKYDGDCSGGCDIPIKITSGVNQEVDLSGLQLFYSSEGISKSTNSIYDLIETPASISTLEESKIQTLFFDEANFSTPPDYGEYPFILKFNNEEIFSQDFSIEEVPEIQSLKPSSTALAYPTDFEIIVKSKDDISKYEWNFGDNITETTETNKIEHTFEEKGTYEVKIKVTDINQKSSLRTFKISVGSPKEIINDLLTKMLENLKYIQSQIEGFTSFEKSNIESKLRINDLEQELGEIQQANASAVAENEAEILKSLLSLEIPESISPTISANSLLFYPNEESLNLEILKEIGGGISIADESEYKNAIIAWYLENLEVSIDFKELSARYSDYEEPILKTFKLKIQNKNQSTPPYFIIRTLEGLNFDKDYSQQEEAGYTYIELFDQESTITFSTTEDVNLVDIPMFISPSIDKLSLVEIQTERDQELLRLAIFILIIFLLVIIGGIVYFILQEWYKRKYETFLFKNKNDLYNLISYVQSSKKKGLNEKDIISKLKASGWKLEQIKYVMRKYSGKRTGMLEIPLGKFMEKFKGKPKLPSQPNEKIIPRKIPPKKGFKI